MTFALGFLFGWLAGGFVVFRAWDRENTETLKVMRGILREDVGASSTPDQGEQPGTGFKGEKN